MIKRMALPSLLNKEHTRNFLRLFTGLFFGQGLSFLLSPILARLYSPEEFGLVAFYMAIAGMLAMVATLKYEQAIMLPSKDSDAHAIFRMVILFTCFFAVLFLVLLFLFHPFWVKLSGEPDLGFWLWFIPLSVFLQGFWQALNYMANRQKFFGAMAWANAGQYTLLNLVRIGWRAASLAGNGLIISQLVAPIYSIFSLGRKIKPYSILKDGLVAGAVKQSVLQARKYAQYPAFNLPQSVSNNLASSLPIFMFTSGFSAEKAGLYAFGYTFVYRPLSLFSQSALQVLSQKIIEDHNNNRQIYPGIKKLIFQMVKLGILPFVVLALFAPQIFSLVFSPAWRESGEMIRILLPWLFLVYLTGPISFMPELFFQQKKSMLIDFVSVTLRFGAIYTGIYYNDLFLALSLFSGVSFLVVAYTLFWYLQMARNQSFTSKNS